MGIERFYFKQFQVQQPEKVGDKPTVIQVEDSLNFLDVNRTRSYLDGTMVVLLKDGHEVDQEVQVPPQVDTTKNGVKKVVNIKRRVWVQSEIRLIPEDAKRFKEITDIMQFLPPRLNIAALNGQEEGEAEVQDTIESSGNGPGPNVTAGVSSN